MQGIVDHKISTKALVDIKLQEEVTMIERPNVEGSSKKQMRHVTPYSFITALIEVQTKEAADARVLYYNLKNLIPILVHKKDGICLKDIEINKIGKIFQKKFKDQYKTLTTDKNSETSEYVLIQKSVLVPTWEKKLCSKLKCKPKKIEEFEQMYDEKRIKYIKYGLDLIANNIDPEDVSTYNLTCETLARLILTLFNEKPLAAFPDEGNSLNYEIRLYKDTESAKNATLDYIVISSADVQKLLAGREELQSKIRIVNNEGYLTDQSVLALKLLNNILKDIGIYNLLNDIEEAEQKKDKMQEIYLEIQKYNSTKILFLKRISSEEKGDSIEVKAEDLEVSALIENLLSDYPQDIADILYLVFDFKPLEKVVFVQSVKAEDGIDVYPSATSEETIAYAIKSGDEYRKAQIDSVKRDVYNKKAKFRANLSPKEELKILANKVVEHLTITLSAFKFFKDGSILIKNLFVEKVKNVYNLIKREVITPEEEDLAVVFDNYFEEAINKVTKIGFFQIPDDVQSLGSEPIDIDTDLY